MAGGRQPVRALLAIAAACALIVSATVLPLFGAAAPAGEVAREIGDLAGAERTNGTTAGQGRPPSGGNGGSGSDGGAGGGDSSSKTGGGRGSGTSSGGGLVDLGLGSSGLLTGESAGTLLDVLAGDGGGSGGSGDSGGEGAGGAGGGGEGAGGGPSVSTGGDASGGGGGLAKLLAKLFGGGGGGGSGGSGGADGGSGSGGSGGDSGSQSSREAAIERAGGQCVEAPPYVVCFPGRIVPGEETTVLALRDGEPAPGVVVTLDGEAAGRTDETGTLTATVPYVRQLSVGVRGPANAVRPTADRHYSLAQPDSNTSVPVDAELQLAVAGEPAPGDNATVRVTLAGRPVTDARVSIDGSAVGRTDAKGRFTVTFPVASTATVRAERGDFDAERTVTLADIAVSLSSRSLPVGLPGQSATVNVTDRGAPLANATIAVGGSRVGRTAADGTVVTTLPFAPMVDVTVTTQTGLTVTRSEQIFVLPLVAFLVLLALAGGAGYLVRQSEATGRGVLEQLRVTLADLAADLLSALVGLASGVEDVLATLREQVRETVAALSNADIDVGTFLRERLVAFRAAVLGLLAVPGERVRALGAQRGDAVGSPADTATGDTSEGLPPRERIEIAWDRFVRRLGIRRRRTTTPGQVASRGIAEGHPADSVRDLTDAFRTVEYSDADPGDHVETAERAAADIGLDDDSAGSTPEPAEGATGESGGPEEGDDR